MVDVTGRVIWISDSFSGSFNDNAIVKEQLREFLSKITKDEWGLGDLGFEGLANTFQIIPCPERGSAHFRLFSSYRVKVENRFASLKKWRSLKDEIRCPLVEEQKALAEHHKRWVVVAALDADYD